MLSPATLSAQVFEHPLDYAGAQTMVDEFVTEKNWLASYRSGDANPCPPPGTWQDSVFVMLTDAPLPTSDHVFMLAASWVDRVLKCGDERALAWYRRHAIEYINPGFGGINAFVRVLEADPVGNRDALLAIAAERRHPMLSRSKALEAVVRGTPDPTYLAAGSAIATVWEGAGDLPSPFIWEELSRLADAASTLHDVAGLVRIAEALSRHPSAEHAYGLASALVAVAAGVPDSHPLITPLENMIDALRTPNADPERIDALESRLRRIGERHQ